MQDYLSYLDFAKSLALEGGAICKSAFSTGVTNAIDKPNQLNHVVTQYDTQIEELYVSRIKECFPDHAIVGEETGRHGTGHKYLWAIDPIDGTSNFARNLPIFGTMIALIHQNEIVAATTYLPMLNEHYWAIKGGGAYLNGKKIFINKETDLSQAYVFIDRGGSSYNNWAANTYSKNQNLVKGFRILGSCAVQSAWIAAGRFHVMIDHGPNIYDIAAGALLVREAGGVISDFSGQDWQIGGKQIIAGNKILVERIVTDFSLT